MKKYKIVWFWIGFCTNLTMNILIILLGLGCTGDYEKGWAWGVVTENGEQVTEKFLWSKTEVRVDDILLSPIDKHENCRDGHYIDPYTKKEYCLPEGFINMEQLHLYKVRNK
ncbi:uncharacterized protein METZ01_LOCUS162665 [marine metagenome]|uniref:Uncharacterized protein n=1 Tax=marine metagenome TaxID=408172 RepID=A0A382B8G2_9ZZZZ